MAFKATHRYARIAPRKARLVLDLIRGRDVEDALALLKFSKKRAAVLVDKVVRSAVANAGEQEADTGSLFVKEAWADPGPTMKRFMPKDRGKAYDIMKHEPPGRQPGQKGREQLGAEDQSNWFPRRHHRGLDVKWYAPAAYGVLVEDYKIRS
jgi:large subunit ribosomal protein L22